MGGCNRYTDYYSLLAHFVGCETGHDKEAENIPVTGKEWAGKGLRKVDRPIYCEGVGVWEGYGWSHGDAWVGR